MSQQILDGVLQSTRLPSLPAIALEVIDLVQQSDVNINHIADTIQHDPALSSKILKTVNSSFYGQSQSVSTISQALVILGFSSVKTLVLGFSLVSNLKDSDDDAFDHYTYWKRSLYSAVAARSLCQQISLMQQEEAFLAALMQDLGMLALVQTRGQEYHEIVAETEHRQLAAREQRKLGIDHAQVGSALAEKWYLPDLLVEPIRYHEDPTSAPEQYVKLIKCVSLGSHIADVFTSDSPGEALASYYNRAEQWIGLTKEEAEPLLTNIHKDTVEMRHLFDLPIGDLENPDEILARAKDALMNLSLETAQHTDELEQLNRELKLKATTDPLTGVANRGKFNDQIAAMFANASAQSPLSVLFLDTDHFKQFNDTYGHQLGDTVLIEVAKVLKQTTPQTGLVARYGGEEFAVVLPKTDRPVAARVAEENRRNIESMNLQTEKGEQLKITASIGVATFEGEFFARVEQLIKAADQAVYAAKSGGRNCVRIFLPKLKSPVA